MSATGLRLGGVVTVQGDRPAGVEETGQASTDPRGLGRITHWWSHARRQPQAHWTAGHALLTRGLHLLLVGSMLCGPVGVWMALQAARAQAPAAVATGYDERAESRRSAAEFAAKEWVVTWLSAAKGQEQMLAAYLPQRMELPKQGAVVRRAAVIAALPADVGVWAVTVQVDLEPVPGARVTRRYYRVPVHVTGEGPAAAAGVMALPTQVPGPAITQASTQVYGVQLDADSALGSTVSAFVQAAISGRADEVSRYSSPGHDIRAALDPSQTQYVSAQVTSMSAAAKVDDPRSGGVPAEGTQVRVKADVALVEKGADNSAGRAATWFLTLTTRAGRWEVSAFDQAPLIPATADSSEGENK